MAVRIEPKPVVIAQQDLFFGPQEVLTLTAAEEPRLFFVKALNGPSFSEYVFDPSSNDWVSVNREFMDYATMKMPAKVQGLRYFSDTQVFHLSEGTTVYSFVDENGGIIYTQEPYNHVWRYAGYELIRRQAGDLPGGFPTNLGTFPQPGRARSIDVY